MTKYEILFLIGTVLIVLGIIIGGMGYIGMQQASWQGWQKIINQMDRLPK